MHFSSKHADDFVRGVGGSGRAERATQAVNNMSEFFETDFGQKSVDKRLWEALERLRRSLTGRVFMK